MCPFQWGRESININFIWSKFIKIFSRKFGFQVNFHSFWVQTAGGFFRRLEPAPGVEISGHFARNKRPLFGACCKWPARQVHTDTKAQEEDEAWKQKKERTIDGSRSTRSTDYADQLDSWSWNKPCYTHALIVRLRPRPFVVVWGCSALSNISMFCGQTILATFAPPWHLLRHAIPWKRKIKSFKCVSQQLVT